MYVGNYLIVIFFFLIITYRYQYYYGKQYILELFSVVFFGKVVVTKLMTFNYLEKLPN